MSDHPTWTIPNGCTVTVNVPPGWFTHVSGLARSSFNQMTRLCVTNSRGTNTEHLIHSPTKPTETNETMKLMRTCEDSYSIGARSDVQHLELTFYYSTNPEIRGSLLEENNAVVSSLVVLQAETPKHLLAKHPDYITFFVFVQASPDQQDSESSPLYNDAVCTINMIKGTGLDHNGFPMKYAGSKRTNTTDGVASDRSTAKSQSGVTRSRTLDGVTTKGGSVKGSLKKAALDIVFLQDCARSQHSYIKALTDSIGDIRTKIASGVNLEPSALRLGLVGFGDAADGYNTKSYAFTNDVSIMKRNLSTLAATGNGGSPEAVTEALEAALLAEWRVDATKMVILITDAPPYGICEPSKGPPASPSSEKEPSKVVRRMAELGITLHLFPCEPSLDTSHNYAYDSYKSLTKITGGSFLPLVSASNLVDYIVGSSLERLELDLLIAEDGKTIARRALFKKENQEVLTKEYHAKYTADGITITTLKIEPLIPGTPKGGNDIEAHNTTAGVVTGYPLLNVFTGLLAMFANLIGVKVFGARVPSEPTREPACPLVTYLKKAISKVQTSRVIELGIAKNAEVLDSGKFVARPTSEDPVNNSCRINVPVGWYGFVSGLSRIRYNQAIKLCYSTRGRTNTEFLISESGQPDNFMRLGRSKESFYIFAASEKSDIVLDTAFFWSRDDTKGDDLNEPRYASQKLKVIQTQTPMHSRGYFPDYITYLIMAEDQPDSYQVADVPEFNDCVGIVNLIKKSPMV